jgi:hypothetical protein
MPSFSEPVPFAFIAQTVAAIFVIIGIGIFLVKKFK